MKKYKRPESVLVIVHTPEGKVLCLRRVQPPDFWQSVTGSLEEDEVPAVAAHRELREETGIDAWPTATGETHRYEILPEWRHRFAPGVKWNIEHVFVVEVPANTDVQPDDREHAEFRWLDRTAAARLASSRTDREAILRHVPGN